MKALIRILEVHQLRHQVHTKAGRKKKPGKIWNKTRKQHTMDTANFPQGHEPDLH